MPPGALILPPKAAAALQAVPACLLAVGLLVLGCQAPRPGADGETGTVEEIGALMAEEGEVEPVLGQVEEGRTAGIVTDPNALADPDSVEFIPESEESFIEESPYILFGERIVVREFEEGPTFITKPYTLPVGKAQKVAELLTALQPFPYRQRPEPNAETGEFPPLDPTLVEYQILGAWDTEYYTNFIPLMAELPAAPTAATPVDISDIFVVTATAELLVEFEDFLDLFAAGGIPQIEIEAKIIEIVESDTLDVGVKPIDDDTPIFQFGSANFVKAFSFDLPNFAESTEALLALGAVQNSFEFNAILEAVQGWQNVSIESRPKTVVRAGGVARIDSSRELPFLDVKTLAPDGTFTTAIQYKRIGIQLVVSPRVIGSSTLALEVHLEGSQQVGTQATLSVGGGGGGLIEVPVIAYRTAKTLVYLEPGQTLVIGGLTQEREQEIVNKVPILGDIPLLGFFFRSTFTSVERQHVLFAISPRIIQRSDFDTDL